MNPKLILAAALGADTAESMGHGATCTMAEGRCHTGGLPAHLHLRLELCRPAGHTHDWPEPGLLPQADALDDGHHLTLCRRLFHLPQPHLRFGPPGLLAGSAAAGDVQRPARTAEVARQVLLLLLSRPHGGYRPAGPLLPISAAEG